jgi:hypothetical protein
MSGSKSTNKNRPKVETAAGQEGKLSAPVGWDNVQALKLRELSAWILSLLLNRPLS